MASDLKPLVPATPADALMKKSILLVDDEEVISKYVSEYLTVVGYDVDTAATAKGAIEKCQNRSFDLVLLDLLLPDADGIEVLDKIKACRPHQMVIILTGVSRETEILAECIRKGAHSFVNKGSTVDHLLMHIRRAIGE
jgi:DNA-binding NtrC family response regulator